MADWSNPLITTQYDVFVSEAKARDTDAATMFVSAPTNQPVGAVKLVRAPIKFQEWDGAAWNDKLLDLTGGGTGASTAAGARTALGIGTMGVENSNAIAVTGGTIAGLTSFDLSGPITFSADGSWNIGTLLKRAGTAYIKNALVIPCGTDLYATS